MKLNTLYRDTLTHLWGSGAITSHFKRNKLVFTMDKPTYIGTIYGSDDEVTEVFLVKTTSYFYGVLKFQGKTAVRFNDIKVFLTMICNVCSEEVFPVIHDKRKKRFFLIAEKTWY